MRNHEYLSVDQNYEIEEGFGFKLHLMTIMDLFCADLIKLEEALQPSSYLQYCLSKIPYRKMNAVGLFIVDRYIELIMDVANVPDLYWPEKIWRLKHVMNEEKHKRNTPKNIR